MSRRNAPGNHDEAVTANTIRCTGVRTPVMGESKLRGELESRPAVYNPDERIDALITTFRSGATRVSCACFQEGACTAQRTLMDWQIYEDEETYPYPPCIFHQDRGE